MVISVAACQSATMVDISGGVSYVCGLRPDGSPVCWGIGLTDYHPDPGDGAEANVSPEGQAEGGREGEAQGDVPPGNRKGIGHTQEHDEEIPGCRGSADAAIPSNTKPI